MAGARRRFVWCSGGFRPRSAVRADDRARHLGDAWQGIRATGHDEVGILLSPAARRRRSRQKLLPACARCPVRRAPPRHRPEPQDCPSVVPGRRWKPGASSRRAISNRRRGSACTWSGLKSGRSVAIASSVSAAVSSHTSAASEILSAAPRGEVHRRGIRPLRSRQKAAVSQPRRRSCPPSGSRPAGQTPSRRVPSAAPHPRCRPGAPGRPPRPAGRGHPAP